MKLDKIDIITNDTKRMVPFYEAVFTMKMTPLPVGEHEFWMGELDSGIKVQFVPGKFLGVDLKRNRQQLNFRVDNLDAIMTACLDNGGEQEGEVQQSEDVRTFSVRDPDGNFIVFFG